jgi:hypothetical protein
VSHGMNQGRRGRSCKGPRPRTSGDFSRGDRARREGRHRVKLREREDTTRRKGAGNGRAPESGDGGEARHGRQAERVVGGDLREEKGRGKRRRGKGAKKWRQGRAERGLCRPGGRKAASVTLGREWW